MNAENTRDSVPNSEGAMTRLHGAGRALQSPIAAANAMFTTLSRMPNSRSAAAPSAAITVAAGSAPMGYCRYRCRYRPHYRPRYYRYCGGADQILLRSLFSRTIYLVVPKF
jgi:hypothetical protein